MCHSKRDQCINRKPTFDFQYDLTLFSSWEVKYWLPAIPPICLFYSEKQRSIINLQMCVRCTDLTADQMLFCDWTITAVNKVGETSHQIRVLPTDKYTNIWMEKLQFNLFIAWGLNEVMCCFLNGYTPKQWR